MDLYKYMSRFFDQKFTFSPHNRFNLNLFANDSNFNFQLVDIIARDCFTSWNVCGVRPVYTVSGKKISFIKKHIDLSTNKMRHRIRYLQKELYTSPWHIRQLFYNAKHNTSHNSLKRTSGREKNQTVHVYVRSSCIFWWNMCVNFTMRSTFSFVTRRSCQHMKSNTFRRAFENTALWKQMVFRIVVKGSSSDRQHLHKKHLHKDKMFTLYIQYEGLKLIFKGDKKKFHNFNPKSCYHISSVSSNAM